MRPPRALASLLVLASTGASGAPPASTDPLNIVGTWQVKTTLQVDTCSTSTSEIEASMWTFTWRDGRYQAVVTGSSAELRLQEPEPHTDGNAIRLAVRGALSKSRATGTPMFSLAGAEPLEIYQVTSTVWEVESDGASLSGTKVSTSFKERVTDGYIDWEACASVAAVEMSRNSASAGPAPLPF